MQDCNDYTSQCHSVVLQSRNVKLIWLHRLDLGLKGPHGLDLDPPWATGQVSAVNTTVAHPAATKISPYWGPRISVARQVTRSSRGFCYHHLCCCQNPGPSRNPMGQIQLTYCMFDTSALEHIRTVLLIKSYFNRKCLNFSLFRNSHGLKPQVFSYSTWSSHEHAYDRPRLQPVSRDNY